MARIIFIMAACLLTPWCASAQVCRLSAAGLNQARRVIGGVNTECPGQLHSPPFGNWGVSSEFGHAIDGHQFDGWCHDSLVCDNTGACKTDCRDGWYEWNSCTDHSSYKAPNCTLYNDKGCTEQATTQAVNVHGSKEVDLPVSCPVDSDRDGVLDSGGCKDLVQYSPGTNYMSLYELDPVTGNDLVQTLYFPPAPVTLGCEVWGCPPAGSAWVEPSAYDSPKSPARVYAQIATVVNFGSFLDPGRACKIGEFGATHVSGATFIGPAVAPSSIATAFGQALATRTEAAQRNPLPTSLAATTVKVIDSRGTERAAPLYFASGRQVNYFMPDGTADGRATIVVTNGGGFVSRGTVEIARVVPGLFTVLAGTYFFPAAVVVRAAADGRQTVDPVVECPASQNCIPRPVDLGAATDQAFLVLFGTGLRYRQNAVSVTVAGINCEISYAGPQETYWGLDQVNAKLPRSLAGRGLVEVVLIVDGKRANTTWVSFR